MYKFNPKIGENVKSLSVFPPTIPLFAVYQDELEKCFYTREVLFLVVREVINTGSVVESRIQVNPVAFDNNLENLKEEGSEESNPGFVGLSLSKSLDQRSWKNRVDGSQVDESTPFSPIGKIPGGILMENTIQQESSECESPVILRGTQAVPIKRGRGRPRKS